MLTTGQVLQRRRFASSPTGGFSPDEVDAFVGRVLRTLDSYESTGTPDAGGLTAEEVTDVTFTSVRSGPGYGFLDVQDFLDSVHDTLAVLESRVTYPPQAMSLARAATVPAAAGAVPAEGFTSPTWTPQGAGPGDTAVLPAAVAAAPAAPAGAHVPPSEAREVRRGPTNLSSAVGVLSRAAVRAPTAHAPAARVPAPAATSWTAAPPAPAPAPQPVRGMDVDALIFELQRAAAQSRTRGSLRVEVHTSGGTAPVLRVLESVPGTITIVAQ